MGCRTDKDALKRVTMMLPLGTISKSATRGSEENLYGPSGDTCPPSLASGGEVGTRIPEMGAGQPAVFDQTQRRHRLVMLVCGPEVPGSIMACRRGDDTRSAEPTIGDVPARRPRAARCAGRRRSEFPLRVVPSPEELRPPPIAASCDSPLLPLKNRSRLKESDHERST